jgi:FAD/FMN-containing dehydrogenase
VTTISSGTSYVTVLTPGDELEAALIDLESGLTGRVLRPGDEDYEEARLVQNAIHDRFPAVIAQPASANDVALALRFARSRGMTISVRSGGHSFAGLSVNNGGMVIDLRGLNALSIEPETGIARAGPAVTSAVLGAAAQEHGLALSTGDTSSVGLGGLTLGGGIGWMVRKQGLTIDSLLSAEMVTAEGEIVRASAEENPDLFWALRGGGGNFGIVTQFEYQLHKVGTIYGGLIALPATSEAVRAYADYARWAPNELTTIAALMASPPAPFVPEELVGKPALIVLVCYAGDASEGQRVVEPMRQIAQPLFELMMPMPYPAIYDFTAEAAQRLRFVARSMFLDELPDDVIDISIDAMQMISPMSMIQIRPLGGRMAEIGASDTAFAHRDAGFMFASIGIWEEGESGQSEASWAQAVYEMTAPYGNGVYVNFLQDEPERIREAYPGETYDRLVVIKRRYDPDNVFSQNVNIKAAK